MACHAGLTRASPRRSRARRWWCPQRRSLRVATGGNSGSPPTTSLGPDTRLDGTRDALHDACSSPPAPAGRASDRRQPAQPARDRRRRHGRLHRVPQPGPRAAAAARARALPQHRRRTDVGSEPVRRLRGRRHGADVRARLHDACPPVNGVRPPGAPVLRRPLPGVLRPRDPGLPGRRRDVRPRREPLRTGGPGRPGSAS